MTVVINEYEPENPGTCNLCQHAPWTYLFIHYIITRLESHMYTYNMFHYYVIMAKKDSFALYPKFNFVRQITGELGKPR